MCVVPGRHYQTSRDRIVVLTANYDTGAGTGATVTVTTTPGVDDNASGAVALLELARLLATGAADSCKRCRWRALVRLT